MRNLSATRDLIEQSLRAQLLALKPNVAITGGAIVDSLMWDEKRTRVQGTSRLSSMGNDVAEFSLLKLARDPSGDPGMCSIAV